MIGSINHIAIAVPDLDIASAQWRKRVGAVVSSPQRLPEHGVKIVFIAADNGKVELMEPLNDT